MEPRSPRKGEVHNKTKPNKTAPTSRVSHSHGGPLLARPSPSFPRKSCTWEGLPYLIRRGCIQAWKEAPAAAGASCLCQASQSPGGNAARGFGNCYTPVSVRLLALSTRGGCMSRCLPCLHTCSGSNTLCLVPSEAGSGCWWRRPRSKGPNDPARPPGRRAPPPLVDYRWNRAVWCQSACRVLSSPR